MVHCKLFYNTVYYHALGSKPELNILDGKYGGNANIGTHGSFLPINNPSCTHFLCHTIPLFTLCPMCVCVREEKKRGRAEVLWG